MRFLLILCAALLTVCAGKKSYNDFKVYRLNVKSEQQFSILAKFSDNPDIDFWSALKFNDKPIDVMVHPRAQMMFILTLNSYRIQYEILIHNVETIVQQEKMMQIKVPATPKGKITFTQFYRFDHINSYLDELAQNYPNKVTVKSIGNSYQERNMKIVQISTNPNANKPIIFIDAGIHAREWISPAMALYIINKLVETETNNLLDKVDWHILPVLNPDGYEYTHDFDRFWRKTVSFNERCNGTDANRNFGFHWGEGGSSDYPCSEIYRGAYAFSEIETQNVKTYIENLSHRIKLYLTLHSFGNYLLYPWGYTSDLPEDHVELQSLAESVNEAIVQAGGDPYDIGTSTNVLYIAAGGSDDWAKGSAGIQLSYTIELPGGQMSGFVPEPEEILPIVNVTFPGIKVYGNYIAEKFGA